MLYRKYRGDKSILKNKATNNMQRKDFFKFSRTQCRIFEKKRY